MTSPLRHLLVATDFSAASEQAVERAMQLARVQGAAVTLLHVVPASLWEDARGLLAGVLDVASPEALLLQQANRLQRRADELAADSGLQVTQQVRYGRPAAELAAAAAALQADLLVVGAHGAHPIREVTVGTTAQKLLRISPCPVLVVKRAPAGPYRCALAGTDFSTPSAAALALARTIAPTAALHLLHAFELPYDGMMRHAGVEETTAVQYQALARERQMLDLDGWATAQGVAPGARTLHVSHGYAATQVETWVRKLGADLVAIGAHGKSEIEVTFLGSVSLHTVMSAPCDVLLQRGSATV